MSSVMTLRQAGRRRPSIKRVVGGAAAVVFVIAAVSSLGSMFGLLLLMALLMWLIWEEPAWASVWLVALVPPNRFFSLLIFHFSHSQSLTVLSQAWKDLLILVLFLRALDEIIMRRRIKLHFTDVLVIGYLLVSVMYLFYGGDTAKVSLLDRILGFRADSYFMLAYFVGRGIVFERKHIRWLLYGLLPGTALVSLIAGAQFAWSNWFNNLFNRLSFSAFINGQGAFGDVQAIRSRGIAGVNLPRASSLLLSDLALAYFSILAVAVAAAIFLTAKRRADQVWSGVVAVLGVSAIGFTITRSAALAAAVMLLFMAIVARRPLRMASLGLALVIGMLLVLVGGVVSIQAIDALTNSHEASIQGHGSAIQRALDVVQEEPLGRGLGTAGTIGQRLFQGDAVTTENWYLQIATEMGIVAAVLFIAFSVSIAVAAFRSYKRVRDPALARVCLAVVGGSVGFFVLGNALDVWEVPVIAMAFFLLAGIAVGAQDIESDPDYEASR